MGLARRQNTRPADQRASKEDHHGAEIVDGSESKSDLPRDQRTKTKTKTKMKKEPMRTFVFINGRTEIFIKDDDEEIIGILDGQRAQWSKPISGSYTCSPYDMYFFFVALCSFVS